jgi:hypothetical protein
VGVSSRQLQQAPAALPAVPPPTQQLQNETILVPACLLSSTYYKNTCKQCNYSRLAVRVTVTPMRRGLLNFTASGNPLGFSAPTLAVTPGGSIVVVASYSGPGNHPNSSAPAYPGLCGVEWGLGGGPRLRAWQREELCMSRMCAVAFILLAVLNFALVG